MATGYFCLIQGDYSYELATFLFEGYICGDHSGFYRDSFFVVLCPVILHTTSIHKDEDIGAWYTQLCAY